MHRRRFLALSGAALIAPGAWASGTSWSRDFGAFVADGLAATHTPGMSVAAVAGGRTLFSAGYGYADVEAARRVTADSVFQIASVSKTVTATAMMLLLQDGRFKLDDAVAPHLDFPLAHPKFPDLPITFRHLFTHTSGISDVIYSDLTFTGPAMKLRDFLTAYLAPGGKWYDPGKSFSDAKPGRHWSYSNVAVALLGYLAGRIGPESLDAITQKRIFAPLGMRDTAWRYEGIAEDRLAEPYAFENARYKRLPHQAYPDWPAGLLCTSANDFAKFLALYTQDGAGILKPESVAAMLTPDPVLPSAEHPEIRQGLIWQLRPLDGHAIVSHGGGDPGAATVAAFDPARKIAALAFANREPDRDFTKFQKDAIQRLLARAVSPDPRTTTVRRG
ncbi:MAG TPA: serine hydrolase domain-containing protein [Rhizomicrobium sp.]|jgi:CubicO group peptidase (beta-lactamase class C family)